MRLRIFWSLIAVLVIAGGGILLATRIRDEDGDPLLCTNCWLGGHHHHASEIAAWRHLNRVARAQFEYYKSDPDAKGRKEYWKKDIAGLWANPDKSGERMGLLWLQEALADDQPQVDLSSHGIREACDGYRIRSLLHANEGIPSPARFAACAYPEHYDAWKWSFIVDEAGLIYRKDLGRVKGVPVYPLNPEAAGWQKYRIVR